MIFKDRTQAGKLLAQRLSSYAGKTDVIVLGLARGGVVVAATIAKILQVSLDVLPVKKIPSPTDPELAVGALVHGGYFHINEPLAKETGADATYLQTQIIELSGELEDRYRFYHKVVPVKSLRGQLLIITDDGAATGMTMAVALEWTKTQNPRRVICALPSASPEAVEKLSPLAHECIILQTRDDFRAVGQWYEQFGQVTDRDVINLLINA